MASIQSFSLQARANELLDAWVKQSVSPEGVKGAVVSKREAQALCKQAKALDTAGVDVLKSALLQRLQGDGFDVAPEARQVFIDFFKLTPESIPVSSTKGRPVQNAQATRVANEADRSVRVSTKEIREMARNAAAMPDNLKAMVGHSVLSAMQSGQLKLDAEGRKELTKFIAMSGAHQSPRLSDIAGGMAAGVHNAMLGAARALPMMGRQAMAETINVVEGRGGLDALDTALSVGAQPMSYAQYVAMHGGSFEDILFAFLMQLADKADKKLLEKIEQMDKAGRTKKTGAQSAIEQIMADGKADPETAAVTPPAGAGAGAGGGKVARVSTQLEAVVQSAHASVQGASEGGAQITKKEADRLVSKLSSLPKNVQELLAGSMATAIKAKGLPLQPEAFDALQTWGKSVVGDKFNVEGMRAGSAALPLAPDTNLARALSLSDKLEDKIASFLVDSLVDPDKDLKSKFVPFKAMRQQIDDFASGLTPSVNTPLQTEVPQIHQPGKPKKGKKAAEGTAAAETPKAEAKPENKLEELLGGLKDAQKAEAALAPAAAQEPESEAVSQNEIQRLMQERNRIFDMLSNIMKAMHDMMMSSIRNMR
jgi:hypothetical protein